MKRLARQIRPRLLAAAFGLFVLTPAWPDTPPTQPENSATVAPVTGELPAGTSDADTTGAANKSPAESGAASPGTAETSSPASDGAHDVETPVASPAPVAVAEPPAPIASPPSAAQTTASPAPRAKVVLLPVDFTVYLLSSAGREAVPDWTTAARKNLTDALDLALANRANLEFVSLPPLTPDEQRTLDAYMSVAKLIVMQGSQLRGRDWETRRADFDRHLGPGLQWLRERTGADYVVVVGGAQVEQSGGLVFTQLLAAAAGVVIGVGGGTFITTTLVDLAAGEVKWFNSTIGVEVFGIDAVDFRKPESTAKVLTKLIEPYPLIPALETKP